MTSEARTRYQHSDVSEIAHLRPVYARADRV